MDLFRFIEITYKYIFYSINSISLTYLSVIVSNEFELHIVLNYPVLTFCIGQSGYSLHNITFSQLIYEDQLNLNHAISVHKYVNEFY